MKAETISLSGRRKKKLERQVEKYLSALQTHRNDYKLHVDLGDTYAEMEDLDKSVESYYGAIELLRQAPAVGKTKTLVIDLYEKIIERSPEAYHAYIELSEEYIAAGQKEKAFRFLLTSAKKAYEEENYELALACYNQAIAKGRTNPHIVERCTELYIKLGRTKDAMQNYLQIGDMYAQDEKNIEALEYYKKACTLEPDNPELLLKVARMYNAMAWTENAASELVKVGEYYEHNHEYTEALRYYNYSVRLDPENERAQEGRVRINRSSSVDGLIMSDEASEAVAHKTAQSDVLDQLDHIEDTLEDFSEPPTTAQFELTPLDATLTFDGSELDDAELDDVSLSGGVTLRDDHDVDMGTIVLDDALTDQDVEDSETLRFDGDQHLAGQQAVSAVPEETLWFSPGLEDAMPLDMEEFPATELPSLHLETESGRELGFESQPSIDLFMLDDREMDEAEDRELFTPNLFSISDEEETSEVQKTADAFAFVDSSESRAPARIEPAMLPMSDGAEPFGDLQSFINDNDDHLLSEAETLFLYENRNADYAEELSPFDEDLAPFGQDANALPAAAESSTPESGRGAASSISLEDWIIDLKEDELVELALEEALREQEQETAANWEELLGLTSSRGPETPFDGAPSNGPQLSLPEQAHIANQDDATMTDTSSPFKDLGATGDIIDIQAEVRQNVPSQKAEPDDALLADTDMFDVASDDDAELLRSKFINDMDEFDRTEERVDTESSSQGFFDEEIQDDEQPQEVVIHEEADAIPDTIWLEQTSEDTLDLYLDEDASDEVEAVDESPDDAADETVKLYLEEQDQQDADTNGTMFAEENLEPDEIALEIDTAADDLEDFVSSSPGDVFVQDEEAAEGADMVGDADNDADGLVDMQISYDRPESDEEEVEARDDALLEIQAEEAFADTGEMTAEIHAEHTEEEEFEEEEFAADSPADVLANNLLPEGKYAQAISEPHGAQIEEANIAEREDELTPQTPEAAEIRHIVEESAIDEIFAEHESHEAAETSKISGDIRNLRQRIDDLEQQLERTEEEKYFLQERFAAQISHHKAHEESLQREIADVYRDKAELEKQLQLPVNDVVAETPVPPVSVPPIPVTRSAAATNVAGFENDRYEALIGKIKQKKTRIQQQLQTVLKQREESGRNLSQELNVLANTKQRLQQNLEYIQQVKVRVEEKVNTELRQAQDHVTTLTKTSKALEAQLQEQRQKEQELRKEFTVLRQEKEQLQTEYANTLGELQHEKTGLEQQLQQVSQAKHTVERALQKKLQTLHRSYQQLKREYTTVIELKDAQLAENTQKLSDVTSKYKKLEKILAEIRQERARLNSRLQAEVAARESLEHKLVTIEAHVDTLDVQELKLVKQLGNELERYFAREQHVSDRFQLSLDELEGLLALQEREIQMLVHDQINFAG